MNQISNIIYPYAYLTPRSIIDNTYLHIEELHFSITIGEIRNIFFNLHEVLPEAQPQYIKDNILRFESIHSQYLISFLINLWDKSKKEFLEPDLIINPYTPQSITQYNTDNLSYSHFFQAKNNHMTTLEQDNLNIKLIMGTDEFIPIYKFKSNNLLNKNIVFHENVNNFLITTKILKIVNYLDKFITSNLDKPEELLKPLYQGLEDIIKIECSEKVENFFYAQLSHFILLSLYPLFSTKTAKNINFLEHTILPCLENYHNNSKTMVHIKSIEALLHTIFSDKSNPFKYRNYEPSSYIEPYWKVVSKSFSSIEAMINYHQNNSIVKKYNLSIFDELIENLDNLTKRKNLFINNDLNSKNTHYEKLLMNENFLYNLFTFIIESKYCTNSSFPTIDNILLYELLHQKTIDAIVKILLLENIESQINKFCEKISTGTPSFQILIFFHCLILIESKKNYEQITNILFNSEKKILECLHMIMILPEQENNFIFKSILSHPKIIQLFKKNDFLLYDLLNFKSENQKLMYKKEMKFFNEIFFQRNNIKKPKFEILMKEYYYYLKIFGKINNFIALYILENYSKQYINAQNKNPTTDMFNRNSVEFFVHKLSPKALEKNHILIWQKYHDLDHIIHQIAISVYAQFSPKLKDKKKLVAIFFNKNLIVPIKNIYSDCLLLKFFNEPKNVISYIIEPDQKNYYSFEPNFFVNKKNIIDIPIFRHISLQSQNLQNNTIMTYLILMAFPIPEQFSHYIEKAFKQPDIYNEMIKIIDLNHSSLLPNSRINLIFKNIEKILQEKKCHPYFYNFIENNSTDISKHINPTLKKYIYKDYSIFLEYLKMDSEISINTDIKKNKFNKF